MDWIVDRTIEQCSLGVSIGEETFTDLDLDYADDVALLAEMLETPVAGLLVPGTPGRGYTSRTPGQSMMTFSP